MSSTGGVQCAAPPRAGAAGPIGGAVEGQGGLALRLYWVDTGWGCGGLLVDEKGIVRDSAPIFRRFLGQSIERLSRAYRVVACK